MSQSIPHPAPIPRPASRAAVWASVLCLALVAAAAGTLFAATAGEYQKRAESLNSDLAAEHYALGLWAQEQKLPTEAREQFERTLHLDPSNKDASAKIAEILPAGHKPRNPKCEFTMAGGEKIKADLLMAVLHVETASGPISIPTAEIDIIELSGPPTGDKVMSDSFTGHAVVKADAFPAQCKVGQISPKRVDIKLIRLFRPCADCDGAGSMTCKRCNGTGKLSADRTVCAECNGKGKVKCKACDGTGKIKCPLCGGSGRIQGMWGRLGNQQCPRCRGAGTLDCPECDHGVKTCPVCNGKPNSGKAGVCPVCNGAKTVKCATCDGTGMKAAPKTEDEMKSEAEKANTDKPTPTPAPTE